MRNPFRISFFHPTFCTNRLVGADHHKPKLRISTNLRSWTKFASSEHANENCTKIAQILRHMDESCTKIARIASDEKCAEIARKIARKIQSGQTLARSVRSLEVRGTLLPGHVQPYRTRQRHRCGPVAHSMWFTVCIGGLGVSQAAPKTLDAGSGRGECVAFAP